MLMFNRELLEEFRDLARQYFANDKRLAELIEHACNFAQLTDSFQDPVLDKTLQSIYLEELASSISVSHLVYGPSALARRNKLRQEKLVAGLKAWADKASEKIATSETYKRPSQIGDAPEQMTKRALIEAYSDVWPTIEADLNQASKNGLSDAAGVAGKVGKSKARGWVVQRALTWARGKGRLRRRGQPPSSVFALGQSRSLEDL